MKEKEKKQQTTKMTPFDQNAGYYPTTRTCYKKVSTVSLEKIIVIYFFLKIILPNRQKAYLGQKCCTPVVNLEEEKKINEIT